MSIQITTDTSFEAAILKFPDQVRDTMQSLRIFILEVAEELDNIGLIHETLKWGEPSFVSKNGVTIRMDWKPKNPNQYALYVPCTSRLIETFKLVFGDSLQYEGKRAIVFDLDKPLPKTMLQKCITAALNYHLVKIQPTLGL